VGRVLELGCAFGRITKLLARKWPKAEITALDLSPEQLASARRYCGENPRVRFEQYDFYSGSPFPGSDYDVVIAVEVFLHHPDRVVLDLLKRLAAVGRHIVNIDWSEDWQWPTPEHVWVRDYRKLFSRARFQSAVFPLPKKIGGKQQKLFVAAKQLSPELTDLERGMSESVRSARQSDATAPGEWWEQLSRAMTDLAGIIPRGSTFILVDDAQWGGLTELNGSRIIPFLEKNGRYWGPPDSDATAWKELARLRGAGAHYLIFAWPSFWWLNHYREFHRQLRTTFRILMENERVVVFTLIS
jgi:SAM-dependent methyltransferase